MKRFGVVVLPFLLLFLFILFLFGGSGISGSGGGSPPELSTDAQKNAWEIWSLLKEKGYTEEAIAGLLGNIDQETGGTFVGDTNELSGGGGYGLIQWTPKSNLMTAMKTAGITGDYKSIKTQVEVIDWELSGVGRGYIPTSSYPFSGEEFKKLTDLKKAATAYEMNRERPRDPHPERQELAQKWYDLFSGATSPPSSGGDGSATGWKKKAIELAYADVGKTFPTGWNAEGECIKAVQRWINNGGGRFGVGGVRSGYTGSGAKEVSKSEVQAGDVMQYESITNPDSFSTGVHTLLITGVNGDGTFKIVESNNPGGSGLVSATENWTPRPPANFRTVFWRFP
ncbi:phage tail tip lysozyme [Enterococcus sp. LJL128]